MTKQAESNQAPERKMLSEYISNMLQLMAQTQKDYEWNIQEETRLNQLTQDYLHMLELEDTSYHNRAKIASKLQQCRIDRRNAKDIIATSEPLVGFLASEKGKMLIGQLKEVLGCTRKAEKNIKQRTYTPRILSTDEYRQFSKEDA